MTILEIPSYSLSCNCFFFVSIKWYCFLEFNMAWKKILSYGLELYL